jgi:HTH-type transcriptional regulator / antitoxin HipB
VEKANAYVGRRLAKQRERLGLTQSQLAKRMGTTQAWVAQLETGKREPRWSTLLDFARALELEPMLIPRSRVSAVEAILQHQTDLPIEAPPLTGDRW